MSAAEKAVVRRFYSGVFRDISLAELCIAADYIDHNNEPAGRGPAVVCAHIEAMLHTFPDFSLTIEDMIAEGDKVVTRVTGRGTHQGVWMAIVPTGRQVQVKGINIDRVVNGRITEHWGEADTAAMLMQMGVDPFAGRADENAQGSQRPS